jgi:putative OPT family oligopeptide transporter
MARAQGPYPEITVASIAGGIIVGAILNMGIVLAGMQIGFTIVGSEVGAIVGLGLLRGLLRRGSILEINIFQSVASTVNTVNAGVIFTMPVIFLLGMQDEIDYPALILAMIAGAVLGNALIIPLRKQIIDFERLRFPTAVGVAAILKAPGAGVAKALWLVGGIAVSALLKAVTMRWGDTPALLPEELNLGAMLHLPPAFPVVVALSLLTVGAGYLAGKHGLAVLYGTILNFWILAPVCLWLGWVPGDFASVRDAGWGDEPYGRAEAFFGAFRAFTSRPVGIGMILGGAVAGVVVALPAIRAALASLRASPAGSRREEMSFASIQWSIAGGLVALILAVKLVGGSELGWGRVFLVTAVAGVWLWLAGLVVAQTTGRTDWSPLSGLALLAVAITMGILGRDAVLPAVTVGAAICVATSMCADMMSDLKTGYLVGAIPAKQQITQLATCWIGPGIAMATVLLLWKAYGFGPDQAGLLYSRAVEAGPTAVAEYEARGGTATELADGVPDLSAPQATALQASIQIIQSGDVPIGKYLSGAALGGVVSLLASPGLGVMIGLSMYLPLAYLLMFGVGGIANLLITRWKGALWAEDKGVPVAAGFVVGDALVGVVNAIFTVAGTMLS